MTATNKMFQQMMQIALTLLLLTLCSCTPSFRTTHDFDRDIDFSQFQSFGWLAKRPAPPPSAGNAQLQSDLVDRRIRSAIKTEMTQRGFFASSDRPDLLVKFYSGVKDRIRVTDWGYDYHDMYWGGYTGNRRLDVYEYQEGTLVIDLINSTSKQLVWRGTATGALGRNPNPEDLDMLIKAAVKQILDKFPPQER